MEDLKKWLIPKLRRIHYLWPEASKAWKNANVAWGDYLCAICGGIFKRKECQLDHIDPVVPIEGFENWDVHIKRLFVEASKYQVICKPCHKKKTKEENNARHN